MKKLLLVIFVLGFTSYFYSQQTGTFTDKRNGRVYKTVKIGNQIWFAENLNVDKFRNGDLIPEAKTAEEWAKAGEDGKPAWCYYDNKSENGEKYGKLYNWYAVNDKRGLAPEDWRISSKDEFETLATAVNNEGNALKVIGQGTESGVGTNISGFSALLAGYRFNDSRFFDIGINASFWSCTESSTNNAYYMYLGYNRNDIHRYHSTNKGNGFSVRCFKD